VLRDALSNAPVLAFTVLAARVEECPLDRPRGVGGGKGRDHGTTMTRRELAATIDHTLLKPEATPEMIDRLCAEAVEHGFIAVCVNPIWVRRCRERLQGSPVLIASVIGFPLGAEPDAGEGGRDSPGDWRRRDEIDMVVRLGDLVAGDTAVVRDDIAAVAQAVHQASPRHQLK